MVIEWVSIVRYPHSSMVHKWKITSTNGCDWGYPYFRKPPCLAMDEMDVDGMVMMKAPGILANVIKVRQDACAVSHQCCHLQGIERYGPRDKNRKRVQLVDGKGKGETQSFKFNDPCPE